MVELPLNATLDDVVGGANVRLSLEQQRLRFEPGILAHAHQNILYIDEINLVPEEVIDAILDAAATGYCVVRRGRLATSYPARFVLIGSMNPEDGLAAPADHRPHRPARHSSTRWPPRPSGWRWPAGCAPSRTTPRLRRPVRRR